MSFISARNTFFIYDIYKIDENSQEVETREFAEWNPLQGLKILEPNMWKRRSNMKGHHIR